MLGLAVKIIDSQTGNTTERRFERFPVRIGRNALNDIALDSSYVSQFHAVIQLEGEELQIVDLGSRNGTVLPGIGPIAANTPTDLRTSNYEFAVWETVFQVALVEAEELTSAKKKGGVHDLAEEMTRPHGTDVSAALVSHLKPMYDAYRESWATLYREIQQRVGTYDVEARNRFCEELMVAMPNVAAEPDFKRLAGMLPGSPSSSRIPIEVDSGGADVARVESVALQGLVELSTWYLPGAPPPAAVEDVIGFLQSIQDALDVFFKCFVPLREGYKQFEVQMDIHRWRGQGGRRSRVETAKDAHELAKALLDWREAVGDEPQTVASTFAELMTHQVAILNGVMKGVKSLLRELAPATLERELENPSRGPRQGLQIGPFRFKQLWDLYVERHGDLSSEDNQAFALIFGPQFAEAYAQFSGGAAPGARTTSVKVPEQAYMTMPPPRGPSEPSRR